MGTEIPAASPTCRTAALPEIKAARCSGTPTRWWCSPVISPARSPAAAGLSKTSAGTLILGGANTYTSGTTISGGTLQLGDGGAAGSILGDVTNNGTLAFNRSNTYAFGGAISGSGGVQQIGTGTTILTNANTYTGGTTITGGILEVAHVTGGAIDALGPAGGVNKVNFNGGELRSSVSGTLANNLNFIGSGTIAVAAGKTVDFTGTSFQVTPGSTVRFGTASDTGTVLLDVFGGGVGGSSFAGLEINGGTRARQRLAISAAVPDQLRRHHDSGGGATLDFNDQAPSFNGIRSLLGAGSVVTGTSASTMLNIGDGNFSGVISGAGGIVRISTFGGTTSATDKLILSGDNTYTGGTTISGGTLQLGNGGTTGSIVGNVVNNGTLAINRSNGYVFGGTISGGGGLQQNGAGITVLTADNTYTGGTTISAGTLQLGNGGTSGSVTGNVVDNGTLAINHSDSFTFGNAISGTGGFAQNGNGTTILTATNTYSGATAVNAGMLVVNGSIANSATTINSGAVLSGIGTVGALTVKSGGAFAPGPIGTPGTMTVAGNLAFQSGAMYIVQVTPSAASSANVTAVAARPRSPARSTRCSPPAAT